jgi:16S rRNA (guanine(966)-N(2))-methyltransferase RsmD
LDQKDLRPSSDRVRETLFNWLGQDLTGFRVLDVFAGSGALGFEAASRNASQITLIEKEKKTYEQLIHQFELLSSSPIPGNLKILHTDGVRHMQSLQNKTYELIFLDPPFSQPNLLEVAAQEAIRICDDQRGGIYIECPVQFDLSKLESLMPNWIPTKKLETAQVKAVLFRHRSR